MHVEVGDDDVEVLAGERRERVGGVGDATTHGEAAPREADLRASRAMLALVVDDEDAGAHATSSTIGK